MGTVHIIYISSFSFSAVILNYAMFLMQQHNDKQYYEFLRMMKKLNIFRNIRCCICCGSSMEQEMTETTMDTLPEIKSPTSAKETGTESVITNINDTKCGGVGRITLTGTMHHAQNTLTPGAPSNIHDDITFTMNEYDSQRTTTSALDRDHQKTQIVIKQLNFAIDNNEKLDGNGKY